MVRFTVKRSEEWLKRADRIMDELTQLQREVDQYKPSAKGSRLQHMQNIAGALRKTRAEAFDLRGHCVNLKQSTERSNGV